MPQAVDITPPFRLHLDIKRPLRRAVWKAARPAAERALGLARMNDIYARSTPAADAADFIRRVLNDLQIAVAVDGVDIARIPETGPLIVVANHPFGGLEGLILAAVLHRVRSDVRVLANYLLHSIPELRDIFFFVDPFGGAGAAERNAAPIKATLRWVRDGGALAVFPAGEVSHYSPRQRGVTDPPWSESIARLVRATGAVVLPVHFDGANSAIFQLAGMIHPRLRTALLPRQFINKKGRTIGVRIGSPILNDRLSQLSCDRERIDYLRARTYLLRHRDRGTPRIASVRHRRGMAPIVAPLPSADVVREFAQLPPEQRLAASGSFTVWHARASQIPTLLREIGRRRELAFREVGEGSGCSIDLDRFDAYYRHLFVWHDESRQVVGAYRLGLTDEVLPRFGRSGLYTTTLFRLRRAVLDALGPAIELGRSFVVPEFQKSYAPLMLLWKGIGHFVVRSPRYRMLFGPVSISNDYQSMTRQLLMAFLQTQKADPALARHVRPRHPLRNRRPRFAERALASVAVRDLDQVEELVREIESDRRGIPILIKLYAKLNARLLGFNVDPDFGDVLDGLILVDLVSVERPILNRYLGVNGSESFLAYHRTQSETGSTSRSR